MTITVSVSCRGYIDALEADGLPVPEDTFETQVIVV